MNVRKQGAWGLWWLCLITFGIYYLVWYQRIKQELATVTGQAPGASGAWWSPLIPFYGLYALAPTAGRLNAAHAALGSTTRVSSVVAWLWAPIWYSSHTRYLQRRLNILHDVINARSGVVPVAA